MSLLGITQSCLLIQSKEASNIRISSCCEEIPLRCSFYDYRHSFLYTDKVSLLSAGLHEFVVEVYDLDLNASRICLELLFSSGESSSLI